MPATSGRTAAGGARSAYCRHQHREWSNQASSISSRLSYCIPGSVPRAPECDIVLQGTRISESGNDPDEPKTPRRRQRGEPWLLRPCGVRRRPEYATAREHGGHRAAADHRGQRRKTFTRTFNPYDQTSLSAANNMQDLTYEPLLMFNMMNPTQAPIPWLASAYSWSDGGKTLTFTVRSGVRWSDGRPLTGADVAFTYNLLKHNPAMQSTAPGPTPLPSSATASGRQGDPHVRRA